MRGCGLSRRYIDVCYCDMFSVVNVYLDHLKFCVVCINSGRYVCYSECDVVSNGVGLEWQHCLYPGMSKEATKGRVYIVN